MTVTKKVIPVETIFMDENNPSSVYVGSSVVWKAVISPENATDKTIIWSIEDNPGSASVDQYGRITGLAAGNAIVRATTTNGQWVQASIQVLSTTVPVERVSLNYSSISLEESETRALTATVYPENATDKTVTWASSNTSVATVTDGLVTARSEGTATITASCGGKTATCLVTVTRRIIEVERIELDHETLSLYEDQSAWLNATVYPADATDRTVIWISSDSSVAFVSDSGYVIALKEGTATITAFAGNASITCRVTVLHTIKVKYITLNKNVLSLKVGESESLIATVVPSDASIQTLSWNSNNPSVASVDENGKVTARKGGKTVISVLAGMREARCEVSVIAENDPEDFENDGEEEEW